MTFGPTEHRAMVEIIVASTVEAMAKQRIVDNLRAEVELLRLQNRQQQEDHARQLQDALSLIEEMRSSLGKGSRS